jgi:hypothetical protein
MGEGFAATQRGGRAASSGGWGLCFHPNESIQICDGFLTIQVHLIFKTGCGKFAIHYFKTMIALKLKSL